MPLNKNILDTVVNCRVCGAGRPVRAMVAFLPRPEDIERLDKHPEDPRSTHFECSQCADPHAQRSKSIPEMKEEATNGVL